MESTDDPDWYRPAPRRKAIAVWAGLLAVMLLAAASFGSPLLAINRLKLAAQHGSEAQLRRLVDFPALHASLKSQIAAELARRGRADRGLGSAILLSDSFIDAVLTPSNLAALINGEGFGPASPPPAFGAAPVAPASTGAPSDPASPPSAIAGAPAAADSPPLSFGYDGLNRFKVSIGQVRGGRAVAFVFARRGPFGWILTDIRLPPAVLAAIGR